ncbi:hypothetical protein AJ79_01529 [Helicocarpus griseus UAMH5409]|uniref:Receptor L-domain domain-containing protein n=1 Tax=Helicocarpus griseus UAMH5409 TaxID=1447875 RepID=A0A2B7Y7R7_9EURO|nr:hypothetical protein AJ79_01529 [Helicocarpus griseus UAMH5409]
MPDVVTKDDMEFYSTCTKIDGMFGPDHNLTGPFEVPNVKTITSRFNAGYLMPKLKGSDRVDDGVTSISMPDLEEVGGWVLMAYLDNLTSVSFPKLRSVGVDVAIINNLELKKLSLPALENVTKGIFLDGSFDEIHLPNLKHTAYLKVESTGNIDCRALGKTLSAQVTFHPEIDVVSKPKEAFTCWTRNENNRYNSSDPASTTSANGTTSGNPADPSDTSKPSGGVAVRAEYMTALFGLIAVAAFEVLVM